MNKLDMLLQKLANQSPGPDPLGQGGQFPPQQPIQGPPGALNPMAAGEGYLPGGDTPEAIELARILQMLGQPPEQALQRGIMR